MYLIIVYMVWFQAEVLWVVTKRFTTEMGNVESLGYVIRVLLDHGCDTMHTILLWMSQIRKSEPNNPRLYPTTGPQCPPPNRTLIGGNNIELTYDIWPQHSQTSLLGNDFIIYKSYLPWQHIWIEIETEISSRRM